MLIMTCYYPRAKYCDVAAEIRHYKKALCFVAKGIVVRHLRLKFTIIENLKYLLNLT